MVYVHLLSLLWINVPKHRLNLIEIAMLGVVIAQNNFKLCLTEMSKSIILYAFPLYQLHLERRHNISKVAQ